MSHPIQHGPPYDLDAIRDAVRKHLEGCDILDLGDASERVALAESLAACLTDDPAECLVCVVRDLRAEHEKIAAGRKA